MNMKKSNHEFTRMKWKRYRNKDNENLNLFLYKHSEAATLCAWKQL